MTDREHLAAMLTALGASPRTLRRPVCRGWVGDWQISGKTGHIPADGPGYLLSANTPERDYPHPDDPSRKLCRGSSVRWKNLKYRLAFARVTQDGDDEGCLHLDRLPTRGEAGAIRAALGIRKRQALTDEARANLAARGAALNRPFSAPQSLPGDGPGGVPA